MGTSSQSSLYDSGTSLVVLNVRDSIDDVAGYLLGRAGGSARAAASG